MEISVDIEVKDKTVQTLMTELQSGKYFLPSFQRQFVWDADDIKDFVDSIINNYPIGAVILWKPSAPDIPGSDPFSKPLIDVFREGKRNESFYILDGQQRLTSLLLLFRDWKIQRGGEEIIRDPISYNLASGKFYKSRKRGLDLSNLVRAFCLEEKKALKDIMDTIPEDKFDEVRGTIRRILEYPIPICIMETYSENEDTFRKMAEAFIRVNRYGMRIGNLELMLSFLAGAVGGELKQRISELYEAFYKDFALDLQPIIRFVFSRFGLKQTQISKVEQFKRNISKISASEGDSIDDIFTRCNESIGLAIQLLKKNLGISSSNLLPSQTVLVPIATYFYGKGLQSLDDLDDDDQKRMINWFILASFNGYYSSRTDTKLDKDLEVIQGSGCFPWDSLIACMEAGRAKTKINYSDIERGLHLNVLRRQRRAHLFLLYINLVKSSADDWSGVLLSQRNHKELARHHIFPKEFLEQNLSLEESGIGEIEISNLGNITFISKDINSEIGDDSPEEYMNSYIESAKKHFVPTERNLWMLDQYDTFLEYRVRQIYTSSKKFFGDIIE